MLLVCSVKDSASGLFGRPFFVSRGAQAVRSFTDEVNRQAADNDLYRHPADFELYSLALFDDNTGGFVPHDRGPEMLVRGKDVARVEVSSDVSIPVPVRGNGHASQSIS